MFNYKFRKKRNLYERKVDHRPAVCSSSFFVAHTNFHVNPMFIGIFLKRYIRYMHSKNEARNYEYILSPLTFNITYYAWRFIDLSRVRYFI